MNRWSIPPFFKGRQRGRKTLHQNRRMHCVLCVLCLCLSNHHHHKCGPVFYSTTETSIFFFFFSNDHFPFFYYYYFLPVVCQSASQPGCLCLLSLMVAFIAHSHWVLMFELCEPHHPSTDDDTRTQVRCCLVTLQNMYIEETLWKGRQTESLPEGGHFNCQQQQKQQPAVYCPPAVVVMEPATMQRRHTVLVWARRRRRSGLLLQHSFDSIAGLHWPLANHLVLPWSLSLQLCVCVWVASERECSSPPVDADAFWERALGSACVCVCVFTSSIG